MTDRKQVNRAFVDHAKWGKKEPEEPKPKPAAPLNLIKKPLKRERMRRVQES